MRHIPEQQRVADIVPAEVPVPALRMPVALQPVVLPPQRLADVHEAEAPVVPARDLQQVAVQEWRPVVQQRGAPALPPRHALPVLEEDLDADETVAQDEHVTADVPSVPAVPSAQPLSSPVATMLARAQQAQTVAYDTESEAGSEWDAASLDEDEGDAYDRAEILMRRPAAMGVSTVVVSPEQQRQNRTQEGAQAELVRTALQARNRVMQQNDEEYDAFSD
jgi:hypothetical protein